MPIKSNSGANKNPILIINKNIPIINMQNNTMANPNNILNATSIFTVYSLNNLINLIYHFYN